MTATSSDDAERVYEYLAEYISAKNFSPTITQIAVALGINHPRATSALKLLNCAGRIRFLPTKRSFRPGITLQTALVSQVTNRTAVESPVGADNIPKQGTITCFQCRKPICEESKWYCALHLRLNREAARRSRMRKRLLRPAA
jgi:hypothetical protein